MRLSKMVVPVFFMLAVFSFGGEFESSPETQKEQSRRFSIKASGGSNYILSSDYNLMIRERNAEIAKSDKSQESFANLNGGINARVEIIFNISRFLGIGLGAGFLQTKKDSLVTEDYSKNFMNGIQKREYAPKMQAIPIFFNFHFSPHISNKLKLDFLIGPSASFSSFTYYYSFKNTFLSQVHQETFKAKKVLFGFQAGLGIEYALSNKLSLVMDGILQYTNLSNLKGSYHYYSDSTLNWSGPTDKNYEDYFLWAYTQNGETWIRPNNNTPIEKNWTNWKKATIVGFEVIGLLGLKIYL